MMNSMDADYIFFERGNRMEKTDFAPDGYGKFESTMTIWGKEGIRIKVHVNAKAGKEDEYLSKYMASINRKLVCSEENRQAVEQALLDSDMLDLAEKWMAKAKKGKDENRECYILKDGQKVFLPISREDFCQSLYLRSIHLSFDEDIDKENPEAQLNLLCNPAYFGQYSIMAIVDPDNYVECMKLAGG